MHLVPFIRQVLALTRPYRFRFILGTLCGFLAGVSTPLLLASVKLVIDAVFPQPGKPGLGEQLQKAPPFIRRVIEYFAPAGVSLDVHSSVVATLLVICTIPLIMLLRGLLAYLNIYLMVWVSIRAVNDLRSRLFNHLLSLSSSFFSDTSTGTLMAHLNAASALQGLLSNSLVTIIKEPIAVIGLVVLLISQQPRLSLVALAILPFTMVPFVVFARKARRASASMQQETTEQSKLIHESLTGYRIIKAYNLEEIVEKEFVNTTRASLGHAMRILRAAEIPGPLMEFFGSVAVAIFLVYIALISEVKMTPGDLLQFIGCIFLLYQPIKALIRVHNQMEQAEAATRVIFDLLKYKSVIVEPAQPKPLVAAGKNIHFDNVTFSYGQKPVLHEIQMTVKAGQVVALVGSSGSGKTTLSNLLLRFYDPQQGAIRIGETDIREVATRDLRSKISVVTQETILFNDTVYRNIELGRAGATEKEIREAARHAHAEQFILEKPQGFGTIIGEKGVQLSGGQRQRIAIARAILKDASILVLDEATSALDTESERAVQAALEELMKGRTTICIAHRLSTIQRADVIVVLAEGRIVETGRHEELLQRNGVYRRLYELQFQN